jgi:hypothetical protein
VIKLIPLSIVIASIVIPMLLAAQPRPKRALRRLQIWMALLIFAWAVLCVQVYPIYVPIE